MMFYREIDNDNGIKRISEQDEANNDHDDAQNLKTTNFSISEILRPEFGQRIKTEPPSPQSFLFRQETYQGYQPESDGTICKNPMLSFDDIFRRYKTFMCAASQYDCSNSPGQSHSFGQLGKEDPEQQNATKSSHSSPESPRSDRDTGNSLWPAWVYCTRYSDRPSAGPRAKKGKHKYKPAPEEKRPRTAFTNEQLNALKKEFNECRYLTEKRRGALAKELELSESQIKIWFQNKRAKIKKTSDAKNTLALNLIAEGLYNHSTVNTTTT